MISSSIMIQLRNFTRALGLNKVIAGFLSSKKYEDRFGDTMIKQVKPGDIVWDIGANLGLYTEKFSVQVSPTGKVIAFEPVPSCFDELHKKYDLNRLVVLKNIALGAKDSTASMNIESNPLAATHKIVDAENITSVNTTLVKVSSADSIISLDPDIIPNIIKIDVEGYEGQVLDGMKNLLKQQKVRCIGIEIHFGLLNERHEANRPQAIENLLKEHGFLVSWTDLSHIVATR